MANAAINETRNIKGTFFSVLGKTFSSYVEAEKWRDSTIARREAYAGRTLTDYELEFGIKRKDDRNLLQRIEDADWRVTPVPSNDPPRHPMDEARGWTSRYKEKRTPLGLYLDQPQPDRPKLDCRQSTYQRCSTRAVSPLSMIVSDTPL